MSKEEEISLADKIELLENYLEIEKIRFRDKLNYSISIKPGVDIHKKMIPTMLLQPIVENAVNHGIFNKKEPGNVSLSFEREGDALKITITDDGVGMNVEDTQNSKLKSSGVLRTRMYYLNQTDHWEIEFFTGDAFPGKEYKGMKVVFIIRKKRKAPD